MHFAVALVAYQLLIARRMVGFLICNICDLNDLRIKCSVSCELINWKAGFFVPQVLSQLNVLGVISYFIFTISSIGALFDNK